MDYNWANISPLKLGVLGGWMVDWILKKVRPNLRSDVVDKN